MRVGSGDGDLSTDTASNTGNADSGAEAMGTVAVQISDDDAN